MPTFGDVVQLFFSTLSKGAQHQYAQQTRGGDYRQKELAADMDMRKQVTSEAQLMEKLTRERDMLRGRASVVAPGGEMPDAEALGAFEGRTALETADMARQKGQADIGLTEAQTRAANRGMGPAELEALRQRGRMDLEGVRSEGREDIARLRAEMTAGNRRPRMRQVQTPNGPMFVDIDEIEPGKPVSGPVPTADMRNRQAALGKIKPIIDAIDNLSTRFATGSGIGARLMGGVKQVAGKLNLDADVAQYEALIQGLTPMIARAVGHTGVLTQQDVDSVRALFPNTGDSEEVRQRKMNQIRELLVAPPSADADPDTVSDLPGGGWHQGAASATAAPAAGKRLRYNPQTGDFE